MITFSSEFEKQEFVQKVLDKLLYCPGFKEDLEVLMTNYKLPKDLKLSHRPMDFNHLKQ